MRNALSAALVLCSSAAPAAAAPRASQAAQDSPILWNVRLQVFAGSTFIPQEAPDIRDVFSTIRPEAGPHAAVPRPATRAMRTAGLEHLPTILDHFAIQNGRKKILYTLN
jgi:hypothetical protein